MKKIIGLLAAVAMMVAMVAGPAAADPNEVDAGTFTGTATVSQGGACGSGAQGLGLPAPNQNINGSWELDTRVSAIVHGPGDLFACGKLTSVAGVGAACGMSKGYDGDGDVNFDSGDHIALDDLTWKVSVGGTLLVIGEVSDHAVGTIIAAVQAQGGAGCVAAGGARDFVVAGAFVVLPVDVTWNDITDLVDPKDNSGIWGPKK